MSIEDKIDALIAAIDKNTAALTGAAPKAAATKPAVVKAAKPAKTEERVVTEFAAKNEATPEQVKAALDKLLKANKRDAAIALLKSFEGAANVSGITEQGQEAMVSFIDQANEILLSA